MLCMCSSVPVMPAGCHFCLTRRLRCFYALIDDTDYCSIRLDTVSYKRRRGAAAVVTRLFTLSPGSAIAAIAMISPRRQRLFAPDRETTGNVMQRASELYQSPSANMGT